MPRRCEGTAAYLEAIALDPKLPGCISKLGVLYAPRGNTIRPFSKVDEASK